MLKKLQNRLNESKGFTLVELIVVIAIMVILIALLVPNVIGYISSAQSTANLSAAKSIYNAAYTAVVNAKALTPGGTPTAANLATTMEDEDLVTVPKGTSATIFYDESSGAVTGVAVSSGTTAPTVASCKATAEGTAPTTTGFNNVSLYDPARGGESVTHVYTTPEVHPGEGATVKLITCSDGGTWTAAS